MQVRTNSGQSCRLYGCFGLSSVWNFCSWPTQEAESSPASCHGQCRPLHGKPQQAQKETTATASPSPAPAGEPLQVRYESFHALTPFYFLSFDTRCPDTHQLTPHGAQLLLHLPHTGIFFLEMSNTDLLSLCISACGNRLRLMASVRKPDNIKREITKLPFYSHSHMTIPGVTGGRDTQLSSLSCLPG